MPHIHELYDYTVTIFIVYEGRVLLVNHPRYQKWLPIGGHVELDEDPEQALFREIAEESGLEVEILSSKPAVASPSMKPLLVPNYLDVHEANPPHKHISLVYFARAKSANFSKSTEHDEVKWFSVQEIEDEAYALAEVDRFYCHEAIRLAGS